eukprot:1159148-Pelagomonas_calceolata.AAC.26
MLPHEDESHPIMRMVMVWRRLAGACHKRHPSPASRVAEQTRHAEQEDTERLSVCLSLPVNCPGLFRTVSVCPCRAKGH